jgi:hypothetical protein
VSDGTPTFSKTHAVSAEQVSLIPQCEECNTFWLPADGEPWEAHWIINGPEDKLVFYCAECAEREFGDRAMKTARWEPAPEPLSLGMLGLVHAMPADEPALVAGIRERLKPAFEGLERGLTVEKNPLSVPAHWALPILVCNCLTHTPSVGEHSVRT